MSSLDEKVKSGDDYEASHAVMPVLDEHHDATSVASDPHRSVVIYLRSATELTLAVDYGCAMCS
jgi:hypothetical protein